MPPWPRQLRVPGGHTRPLGPCKTALALTASGPASPLAIVFRALSSYGGIPPHRPKCPCYVVTIMAIGILELALIVILLNISTACPA